MFLKSLIFTLVITFIVSSNPTVIVATVGPNDANSGKIEEIIPPGSNSTRVKGLAWDILRESFHSMGYTVKLRLYPWKRAFNMTKNGDIDILYPTSKTKEREEFFNFSKESVYFVDFVVYTRKSESMNWNGISSLNGMKIGQMNGWNYGDQWTSSMAIKKHDIRNILEGFKMLDKGRIDGFVGYESNFDRHLKRAGLLGNYKKLPAFGSSEEYLAGTNKSKRVKKILQDFDAGKKKIMKNGTLAKIIKANKIK